MLDVTGLGPISRKLTELLTLLMLLLLLFSHIFNMNKIPLSAKFYAYTLLRFKDTDNKKWLCRPEKVSGRSRNGPLVPVF